MNIKYLNMPDNLFIKSQLERGMKVELDEHTNNKTIARAIAKSHIMETGWKTPTGKWTSLYYPNLSIMEKRLKRQAKRRR
jgi:hypothetical protein